MAMGLTLLKRRFMQRIILTRPAVETGEALGFLRGIEGIAFKQFSRSDIVRHPVVGRIVDACERYRI